MLESHAQLDLCFASFGDEVNHLKLFIRLLRPLQRYNWLGVYMCSDLWHHTEESGLVKALRNTHLIVVDVACITSTACYPIDTLCCSQGMIFNMKVAFPSMGLVKYVGVLLPNLRIYVDWHLGYFQNLSRGYLEGGPPAAQRDSLKKLL